MYFIIFKKMASANQHHSATLVDKPPKTTVCPYCCNGVSRTECHDNPPRSITVCSCAELLKKLETLSDEDRKIALANHNRLADLKCLGMAFENLDNPDCQNVSRAQLESSLGYRIST